MNTTEAVIALELRIAIAEIRALISAMESQARLEEVRQQHPDGKDE